MYVYVHKCGAAIILVLGQVTGACTAAPRGARTKGTPHGSILSVKGKESFAVRVLCLRLDKLFV